MKRLILISILLVSLIFIAGCSGTPTREIVKETVTKYVCLDGTIVSDPELCPKEEPTKEPQPEEEPKEVDGVVSTSFNDFSIMCDKDATDLQKQDLFDEKFRGEYVQWTGQVATIGESEDGYILTLKQCTTTWVSDTKIIMKEDEKDKLLKYEEGDKIKYKAKLIDVNGFLYTLLAIDGEVIE